MIKNGIYSLTATVLDGPDVDVGGVLILHDGRIHGGDSFVFYAGSYDAADGRWQGDMVSREHTPTTRPVEERVQQIEFRGSYDDVPADEIRRVFSQTYPKYFNLGPDAAKLSFAPA